MRKLRIYGIYDNEHSCIPDNTRYCWLAAMALLEVPVPNFEKRWIKRSRLLGLLRMLSIAGIKPDSVWSSQQTFCNVPNVSLGILRNADDFSSVPNLIFFSAYSVMKRHFFLPLRSIFGA